MMTTYKQNTGIKPYLAKKKKNREAKSSKGHLDLEVLVNFFSWRAGEGGDGLWVLVWGCLMCLLVVCFYSEEGLR